MRVEVVNQRGVLTTVAAAIAGTEANIDNISIAERDGIHSTIDMTITVRTANTSPASCAASAPLKAWCG